MHNDKSTCPPTPTFSLKSPALDCTVSPVTSKDLLLDNSSINGHIQCNIDPFETINSDLSTRSIHCYDTDVKVVRSSQFSPTQMKKNINWKRGPISEYSSKSQSKLKFYLRNFPNLKQWIILTYPNCCTPDVFAVKKHMEIMRRYLARKHLSGIRVLEFQEKGLPHFNFVVNGIINEAELREKWLTTIGSSQVLHFDSAIYIEPIYDQIGLSWYLSKPDQKTIPEQYTGIGRLWSKFGSESKMSPNEIITGSEEEINSIVDTFLEYENEQRRENDIKPREYDGVYGFTSYNTASFLRKQISGEYR